MLRDKWLTLGDLNLHIYDFDDEGDILPRHVHDETDIHITIVARGSLTAFGDGWEKTVKSGDVLDWEPGIYHGFTAREPASRLVNVVKNILLLQ